MNFLSNLFKKDQPIKTNADFWNWFQANEKQFFKVIQNNGNIERDFFNKLSPKLNQLKDGFFFLTGMADDHTAELIITAEGVIKNLVFVEELVVAAPRIKGWKFTALKPSLDIENVGINMQGYIFNDETLSFYAREHENYPDEIDLVIVYNDFKEEDKSLITNGVYIFLDNYLGELNSVTSIDNLKVIGKNEVEKELIPIAKLKDFLIWREKEFLEKYYGERYDTENDDYSGIEFKLKNGTPLFAVINTSLLNWDRKASHPWLMTIKINYKGNDVGMPNDRTYKLMDTFEDEVMEALKDSEGYLNIGRETGDNLREIYFACKQFRKASKVMYQFAKKFSERLEIDYDIYKDKYWRAMERYQQNSGL